MPTHAFPDHLRRCAGRAPAAATPPLEPTPLRSCPLLDAAIGHPRSFEGKQIDLAVDSTTDGRIAAKGFVVLDDRRYSPPYDALPIAQHGASGGMDLLAGGIDAATMRRLNFEVDGRKRDPRDVARDFVATLPPRASP